MVSPTTEGHNTTLIQEVPWVIVVQCCIMTFGLWAYRYRDIRENSNWKCNIVDSEDVASGFPKFLGSADGVTPTLAGMFYNFYSYLQLLRHAGQLS